MALSDLVLRRDTNGSPNARSSSSSSPTSSPERSSSVSSPTSSSRSSQTQLVPFKKSNRTSRLENAHHAKQRLLSKTKVFKFLGHKLSNLSNPKKHQERKLLEHIQQGNVFSVLEDLAQGINLNAKDARGNTPLFVAMHAGQLEIMGLLLEKGANLELCNDEGISPVFLACERNQLEMLQMFVKHGAKLDSASTNSQTPLHVACRKNCTSIVEFLLAERVKVNVPVVSSGMTPLMLAARNGNFEIVEMLLDACADVEGEDVRGNTALHYGCENGNYRTVHLLVTAGADPYMPNLQEETPFDVCHEHGHGHILYLLESNGLNNNSMEEVDDLFDEDNQLNENLFANRPPEIVAIIVKNRVKYAKFYLLGSIAEDETGQEEVVVAHLDEVATDASTDVSIEEEEEEEEETTTTAEAKQQQQQAERASEVQAERTASPPSVEQA